MPGHIYCISTYELVIKSLYNYCRWSSYRATKRSLEDKVRYRSIMIDCLCTIPRGVYIFMHTCIVMTLTLQIFFQVHGNKRHIRMLLVARVQIQHEVRNQAAIIVCQCLNSFQMRMVEQMSSCMTQLHFDLLMDLFKMSTSHYTQVYILYTVCSKTFEGENFLTQPQMFYDELANYLTFIIFSCIHKFCVLG